MYRVILLMTFLLMSSVFGKRDTELFCSVCRALVDEVNLKIKQVDPKKKVQIGSFRIDSNGNQQTYEIPFARSEVHLTDVFESICEEFKNYAQTTDKNGRNSVTRTSSRDGSAIHLTGITISSEIQKKIMFICQTIVEEHEEEMIPLFKDDGSHLESYICRNKLELCSETLLKEPWQKPNTASANDNEDEDEDENKVKDTDHREL